MKDFHFGNKSKCMFKMHVDKFPLRKRLELEKNTKRDIQQKDIKKAVKEKKEKKDRKENIKITLALIIIAVGLYFLFPLLLK